MNYLEQDHYLLLDSKYLFVESDNNYSLIYIAGNNHNYIARNIKHDLLIALTKMLSDKKIPSFSELLDTYYNTALSNTASEQLEESYIKLSNYLYKLHPFFSFRPDTCNYDIADKFIVESLVHYSYTHNYFSDFASYIEQASNSGYDMEKSINRHFFSFNEWIIKSILLPITAKTLSAHEDFKEYAAYSPLYEYTKKIGEIYKQKLETHIFQRAYKDLNAHLKSVELSYDNPLSSVYETLKAYTDIIDEYETSNNLLTLSPEQFYIQTILSKDFYDFNKILNDCHVVDIRKYIFDTAFNEQVTSSLQRTGSVIEVLGTNIQDGVLSDPNYAKLENSLMDILKEPTTATEFYTFEQLVFLELNAIIRQNQLLRICPYCNKPFLSKSRKTKYCPADRNLGKVYQQKYKERTAEQNEYYKAAYRFKSSIDKRMRRLSSNAQEKVLYNLCIADIDNLLSHAQDYTLEEFTDYLNELLTKRGLKPLRKYSKN